MSGESITHPLQVLSVEAQSMLSALLNPQKIVPTDGNLPRDWRGIAELAGIPAESIALFEGKPDPFKETLSFMTVNDKIKITVEDLKAFLGVIDRFDVLEDISAVLDRDVASYKSRIGEMHLDRNPNELSVQQDSTIITFEDAWRAQSNLPFCRYDAFVLHSEEDGQFAAEILYRMESNYNLKLCSKDRDLLPGLRFEHEVIGRIIESRCNRLLVIFSPSFLQSTANQFLVSYAQAIALDTRSRKIIPVMYKGCELPPSVRFSFCLDFNRSGKLWNFWDKLGQSLATARATTSSAVNVTIEAIKENTGLDENADLEYESKAIEESSGFYNPLKGESPIKPDVVLRPLSLPVAGESASSNGLPPKPSIVEQFDALSVNSQARLLPAASSSSSSSGGKKPSKWLSKIMAPISRKKKADKEKGKQSSIAE